MNYRNLIDGDVIQIGDEWFNGEWDGPLSWVAVRENNKYLGEIYNSKTMYPARRPIENEQN